MNARHLFVPCKGYLFKDYGANWIFLLDKRLEDFAEIATELRDTKQEARKTSITTSSGGLGPRRMQLWMKGTQNVETRKNCRCPCCHREGKATARQLSVRLLFSIYLGVSKGTHIKPVVSAHEP